MKKNHSAGLFWSFFKIGLFTFGGGYAMLPMMQREITEKHKWATEEEVLDCYAIGQSTPGIIAINTATFIGYRTGGVFGSLAATLGMVTPSLIIITALSTVILLYRDNPYVQKALLGIQGAVVALVGVSIIKMAGKAFKNVLTYILGAVGFAALFIFRIPAYFIIAGALLFSFVYTFIIGRRVR